MSEYTPTTEQVRRCWVREWAPSPELEAQFDRWLAAELRKAKAEALRDLAKDTDALEVASRDGMNSRGGPFPWNAAKGVRDMLYARADELEGAGDDHER